MSLSKIFSFVLVIILSFSSYIQTFATETIKISTSQNQMQVEKDKRLAERQALKIARSKPKFKDGIWIVWKDIQPGTYRTKRKSNSCYYSRVSGFGWTIKEIIANEFTNSPAIVTIDASDKWFISKNCGVWTQDLSKITRNINSFSDGTFIIGTDISSWTYQSSGGNGCYYVRMKNFLGNINSIISNEFTNEPSIVTIDVTDAGFKSNNCGTWKKID